MRVGLFFGSFNPIHIGHLIIANEALQTKLIDQVWLCPTPQNPHKKKHSLLDYQKRIDLCHLALKDKISSIVINDFERFLEKPSYTANSMRYLIKKYTKYSFSLIVGEDNYKTLHKWHDASWLMEKFPFLIYTRMYLEDEIPASKQKVLYKHHQFFGCELLDISSSSIRRRIQEGRSIEYLTPPAVVKEIMLYKLYQKND
ncbi:MAG: nicotinate (nicotinamide) nucleotide adenylyltransferase [Saprospirales bacterium]|nr:nicotinate (nicotinamide) nucleotide adenylyltransferase [Saprospirales bacterium]|tara:strand:+ start:342 stop:941 length:600 start_codon:yes stop_codon:yes gene_type:complete